MNHYPVSVVLLLLCFFSIIRASSDDDPAHAGGDILSVNCGSTGTSAAARSGREWHGDVQKKKLSSLAELKGSSTTSTVVRHNSILDPVPYKTARLSRSRFSYAFQVSPGQKVLRLHFNSGPYKGFKRYNDLFDVESGPFTLLGNFSASLSAVALGVNSFVKEFCMNIEENQLLNVIFSPASSQLRDTYAFVNGIEIISVSAVRSYFNMEHAGVQLEGEPPFHIDNSIALEIIRRLNIRQDSVSSSIDDIGDGFGMWETVSKQKGNKVNNITWKVSVDVGFRYLVRLHFSRMGFKFAELNGFTFEVQINQKIVNITSDRAIERDDDGGHLYRDYMVRMKGSKQEGKHEFWINLQSNGEFGDGHGPVKGFEILKLSNDYNSLASPNPLPYVNDSSYKTLQTLVKVLGRKGAISSAAMIVLILVNMMVYALWTIQEASHREEEGVLLVKPSQRLCRRFSLVEMQLATSNFHDAHLVGRGGFGKVYRGIIDNGRETVAIKRLKPNKSQGVRGFLTEIEMLTELRHVNLVSLIGYCNEYKEMILVYEFMKFGTLDDHLFKLERNDENTSPLTWKQRLNICIGAGRGICYLHSSPSIVHRDVKPSNILLDEDFTAKVSDFGLAKHFGTGKHQQSHISTKVWGTRGYLDPAYVKTGKLTRNSDIYSFGVVLLEVLSGRRTIDREFPEDEQILTEWAQKHISKGTTDQIVASSLRGQIMDESLKAFVGVAERCLHNEPEERPTMTQVLAQLEIALKLQESSKISVPNETSNLEDLHPLNDEASSSSSLVRLTRPVVAVEKEKVGIGVEFLLGTLQKLLVHHGNLIVGVKDKIEQLQTDLQVLRAILKDTTTREQKNNAFLDLLRQIRDLIYNAEDIIDAFVTQAAEARAKPYIKSIFKKPLEYHDIAKQVENISKKIKEIYGDKSKLDLANLKIGDDGPEKPPEPPQVEEENVVGFEDEISKIIGYLKENTSQLDVISIVGMPGLGKTTVAKKVFRDEIIQYEFLKCIWVCVSQDFTKKVFLDILREFIEITEHMYLKSDAELAQLVCSYLERGKFLIVMDDVWKTQDWDKIKIALPKSHNGSKVLITSRHVKVALHANPHKQPHMLRFLTLAESWELLQYKVYGKSKCPPELEGLGRLIVEQCKRLPLAIVIIGGILNKKSLEDIGVHEMAWEEVSNHVSAYLVIDKDAQERMEFIIRLSYWNLPYHLKACFLYFGMFPEDFEIPAWKLIRLWIAEGFIEQQNIISLEQTAENNLEELINRNLVRVEKRRANGRVKTCRIHDILREFCINEAGSEMENFLQEIKWTPEGYGSQVNAIKNCRRICMHSNILYFLKMKPVSYRVRSLVCFSKEEIALPKEHVSAIPAGFRLLRVLDVMPIKLIKIPAEMYQLLHLRYLTLSFNSDVLPKSLDKFWYIETLVINTSSRTLRIEVDIWSMRQLRHLKTNASANLPKVQKNSEGGELFQTLGTISPQSCTEEAFGKTQNLKILGIRGELASLLDSKTIAFNNLLKLRSLEKLKLLNDVFPRAAYEVPLPGLPPPYQFPPKLKSLTLSETYLEWFQMSILGLLENLEVLKLKDKAFQGPSWRAKDGHFRQLKVLHIGRTDLKVWVASHEHFPRLKHLELHYCEQLIEVPFGLAGISSFQMLDLQRCTVAATSAVRIGEAKKRENPRFNYSIFPPLPQA